MKTARLALTLTLVAACRKEAPIATDPVATSPRASTSAAPSASSSSPASLAPSAKPPLSEIAPLSIKTAPFKLWQLVSHGPEEGRMFPLFPVDMPRPFYIHRLREVMLVTHESEDAWVMVGDRLKLITWWEHPRGRRLPSGFIGDADAVRVVGRYPGDLWVTYDTTTNDGARLYAGNETITVRTGHGRGLEVLNAPNDPFPRLSTTEPPTFAEAWTQGGVLKLDAKGFSFSGIAKNVPLPVRTVSKDGGPRVAIEALAAIPRGDVAVAGRDEEDPGHAALERWSAGMAQGEVLPLPVELPLPRSVLLQANEKVTYVAISKQRARREAGEDGLSGGVLITIEGSKVSARAIPGDRGIREMMLAQDGSLWLVLSRGREGLYRLDGPDTLIGVDAPERFTSAGLFARNGRLAYLGGVIDKAGVILSTVNGPLFDTDAPPNGSASAAKAPPPPSASSAVTPAPSGSSATDDGPAPTPYTSSCTTPFVVMFSVSKTTPADFEYPATRDALLGWEEAKKLTFVEYTYKGARTLGARAPDRETGEALVARLKERVKGSAPALVCFSPTRVLRQLSFSTP